MQDELAEEQDAADDEKALACGKDHGIHVEFQPAGEQGEDEHHGHDGEVLENEHGKAYLPLRGFGERLLLQNAQHYGRGGKRDHASVHDAEPRPAPPEGEGEDEGRGQKHLGGAAEKERLFQAYQFLAGKLHAYGEHEEGHPHFRHHVHGFRAGNEPEGRRAAQNAGEQKAYNGGQAEAETDEDDDDGKNKQYDDFVEDQFFHGNSILRALLRKGGKRRKFFLPEPV